MSGSGRTVGNFTAVSPRVGWWWVVAGWDSLSPKLEASHYGGLQGFGLSFAIKQLTCWRLFPVVFIALLISGGRAEQN